MTDAFNKWWDADLFAENNPFEGCTPAYWAWEGWCAALAEQPAQQEPVAWMWVVDGKPKTVSFGGANSNTPKEWAVLPLYTTPPAQQVLTPWSKALEDEWAEPDEASPPTQQQEKNT